MCMHLVKRVENFALNPLPGIHVYVALPIDAGALDYTTMVVKSSVLVIDPRSGDGFPLIICTECGK